MISKRLAIAVAVIVLTGIGAGQALAQQGSAPPAPTMAAPAGGTAAAPTGAPAATPAPAVATPAITTPPPGGPNAATGAEKENPYGLKQLWNGANGHVDWVARGVMIILAIMSIGTWYIFVMKYLEQSRVLGQASQVEKRFWSSNNLNEGIDKLAKNSVFRTVAESGVRASSGQGSGIVNLNDWIAMSLNRQLEEINSKLQGGIAFLASVGSTAPFVGLFGTVWGILNALINMGVAGQPSIDKVAGPVGEALIMTALGLLVAVPGVLLYNFLVRRNKVISEKLRAFATDLQTYLVTKGK
jgi:biopolymer transport protein ExbB